MPKPERLSIIQSIQKERKDSFVISYMTTTRPGLDVPMSMDVIRKFYDHLDHLNDKRRGVDIDLYLYSNGGDGTVPWRIVALIREFAKKFSIIVPFNAFSAATLTALGADEVVMHTMGMLGPTDAAVANNFNPDDKKDPNKKVSINVEDVTAFIKLIKEDVGITHEDELVEAFNKLPEQIHPLALGNAKRSMAQSRMMAKKLLRQHMEAKDDHKINQIVDHLTSKLFYHGHPINRLEAKEIGIKVADAKDELEKQMWDLYLQYDEEMKLGIAFNPFQEFIKANPTLAAQNFSMQNGMLIPSAAGQPMGAPNYTTTSINCKLVYIESIITTDCYDMDLELTGLKMLDGQYKINTTVKRQEWIKE